jgi:hypothetical protein
MNPIQEAIKEIDSREEGATFSYTQVAKKYGVDVDRRDFTYLSADGINT